MTTYHLFALPFSAKCRHSPPHCAVTSATRRPHTKKYQGEERGKSYGHTSVLDFEWQTLPSAQPHKKNNVTYGPRILFSSTPNPPSSKMSLRHARTGSAKCCGAVRRVFIIAPLRNNGKHVTDKHSTWDTQAVKIVYSILRNHPIEDLFRLSSSRAAQSIEIKKNGGAVAYSQPLRRFLPHRDVRRGMQHMRDET